MTFREWRTAAADLLLGAVCAGCGRPAALLCPACAAAVAPDPFIAWPQPTPEELTATPPVPPVAAAVFEDPLRAVLASYKEQGLFGLERFLTKMFVAAMVHTKITVPTLLVPIPSSKNALRGRGYDAVAQLAKQSARQLRAGGFDCLASACLRHRRPVVEQSGLTLAERWANVQGAYRATIPQCADGRVLVVVDDVLTTGATVSEAVRALSIAGHRPRAVVTIAATTRKLPA